MILKNCKRASCVILLLLVSAVDAQAATYNFYQSFPNGGFAKGSFFGDDKYGADGSINIPGYGPDGMLIKCSGRQCPFQALNEVSAFTIEFGGNSLFKSLNHLPDGGLMSIAYDINNNMMSGLFYGNCDGSCSPYWGYSNIGSFALITVPAGLYPAGMEDLFIETNQPMQVFQTPLPGAIGLFLAGFAPIVGFLRRPRK